MRRRLYHGNKKKNEQNQLEHEVSYTMAEIEEVSEEANRTGELCSISRRNKSSSKKAGHLTYWQSVLGLLASHLKWETYKANRREKKGG